MKHLILPAVLLLGMLATSCGTTQKLYEAGEYDRIILSKSQKICSGHIRPREVEFVGLSYHEANQADHNRILELKATGEPGIWPEVYERYRSMKGRSEALSCFPRALKNRIRYTELNLDEELTASRNKADAYLTAKINQTLSQERPDLDEADLLIKELERINPDNASLSDFKLKSLAKRYGDLSRLMHIEVFQRTVSPERDETATFKESREGLTATVTDHQLSKSATLKGKVNFIDPRSKDMLLSMPYEVSSSFSYRYTTVEGSTEACSEQTLERMKQRPIPFPTDESLVEDAERQLLDLIQKKIQ